MPVLDPKYSRICMFAHAHTHIYIYKCIYVKNSYKSTIRQYDILKLDVIKHACNLSIIFCYVRNLRPTLSQKIKTNRMARWDFFKIYLCVCVHMGAVPVEAPRGRQISWSWNDRQL